MLCPRITHHVDKRLAGEPNCPMTIMQWQHGNFNIDSDAILILNPIKVDGRQLLSDPCANDRQSIYTRYNQTESFKVTHKPNKSSLRNASAHLCSVFQCVQRPPYHGVMRLDLQFSHGKLLHLMYLADSTPQMLPTSTLSPVVNRR